MWEHALQRQEQPGGGIGLHKEVAKDADLGFKALV